MKLTHSLLAAALVAALPLYASAEPASPAAAHAAGVQRDARQADRIQEGLRSGRLNHREAARLEKEQAHVDRLQARALRDGKVTRAEHDRIRAAQNRLSRDIARFEHNGRGHANGKLGFREHRQNVAQVHQHAFDQKHDTQSN